MKIAFVTPEYVTENDFDGGLSNYIHKISLALQARGHRVYVFVAAANNEQFEHDGITVFRVNRKPFAMFIFRKIFKGKFSRAMSWGSQSWGLNKALKKQHKKIHFDAVQFASYTATGIFAPKYMKTVSRVSSYQPLWDRAGEVNVAFSQKACTALELYALKKTTGIYGPSQVIADAISAEINKSIDVLESPLPSPIESDPEIYNGQLAKKKYLLFFGTLGLLKGVKEIADVLPRLFAEYKDVSFVFVGKDSGYQKQPMIDHLYQQAGQYRDRCICLGSMRPTQLKPIIEQALAVVLPSRIDNLPNTCTESMALGKIVIGTRGASFDQLITDGENGFLCDIANADSLLTAIEKRLALNDQQCQIMENKSKASVARLKADIVAKKTEVFFKSL